jgi:plastocyanin
MGLKAWHIYGLVLIPVVLLLVGVTYGANERDGTERTVEQERAPEGEGGGPEGSGGNGDSGPQPPEGGGGGGGIQIIATDNAFNTTELEAPAGEEATLELVNQGQSLHNWAIPEQEVTTELIGGGQTTSVTFTLEAGEYEFLCEVHPDDMQGTLSVQ